MSADCNPYQDLDYSPVGTSGSAGVAANWIWRPRKKEPMEGGRSKCTPNSFLLFFPETLVVNGATMQYLVRKENSNKKHARIYF